MREITVHFLFGVRKRLRPKIVIELVLALRKCGKRSRRRAPFMKIEFCHFLIKLRLNSGPPR